MSTLTCTLYYINMFVCDDSYILICMTALLVKETALLVREGQPRALYESRGYSSVLLETEDQFM